MTRGTATGGSADASGVNRSAPIAMSLFGGAMLATVASVSLAQALYVEAIGSLGATTVDPDTYVVAGGYSQKGDGGGGVFMPTGGTVCTPDNGLVFRDKANNCFMRANPTYSVREWGALCDVVEVNAPGAVTWTPPAAGSANGTLTVPTSMLTSPPVVAGAPPKFIAISQIGQPTLWANAGSSALPAVSMTRFPTLGGVQVGYQANDLVSFAGGTFSQQAAIIVDATQGGTITQWHFLWGGLYDPASVASLGTMAQDNAHTYCGVTNGAYTPCGDNVHATGAVLTPAWSGWSVLNKQTISSPGSNYVVGDIVTLTGAGAISNQGHLPKLIVEATASGGVTAFDWVDYGSLSTLPTDPTTLTDGGPSIPGQPFGLTLHTVDWTQAPYASTIVSAGTVTGTGKTAIVVAGAAAFPGTTTVQSFYYGTDDSAAFGSALLATSPSSLIIPGGCGTTIPLNLSLRGSADNLNPSLVGGDRGSSGLYAFAAPPAGRGLTHILGSVLYAGNVVTNKTGQLQFQLTSGGGFRNMFVEGIGIPEGYGYWGLAEGFSAPTSPSHYVGPDVSTTGFNIPTAAAAVSLANSKLLRIENVHISDGGIGAGNATMLMSDGGADPSHALGYDIGNIVFADSRIDSNPLFFAGPSNPDIALNMGTHDSVYRNLTVEDGDKADILAPGGNVFSQIHVGSDAVGATLVNGPAPTIDWTAATIASFGFAGAADYGVYLTGNTSLTQTRCDIANTACVLVSVASDKSQQNPGQYTDTTIGCATFTSVPAGYLGVVLPDGEKGASVTGTAAAAKCAMPPTQLVSLVGSLDATTSLCNNSNAPVAACTGYQGGFHNGQFYTQPAVTYGTVTLSGAVGTSTLYAVPFFSPAGGGTFTGLALQVDNVTGTPTCDLGAYQAFAGKPTALIPGSTAALTITGTGGVTAPTAAPVAVAPGTPYFLAVSCNGPVAVRGVTSTGGAAAPLTGAPDMSTTTPGLTASWPFASSLPSNFPVITIASNGSVPNVLASP